MTARMPTQSCFARQLKGMLMDKMSIIVTHPRNSEIGEDHDDKEEEDLCLDKAKSSIYLIGGGSCNNQKLS